VTIKLENSKVPKKMGKRKGKRNQKKHSKGQEKRELEYKDDGQEYAQVTKMLGNGRVDVLCIDGVKRLGIIRGAMRNKIWINLSDFVLVGLRDFQDNKCDILLKYTSDEVRNLKAYNELPEGTSLTSQEEEQEEESIFDFDDI
jgi:translation initiation factor 1A